jgi:hypothetical protein
MLTKKRFITRGCGALLIALALAACGGKKDPAAIAAELEKIQEQALEAAESGDTAKITKLAAEAAKLAAELEKAQAGGSAGAPAPAVKGTGKNYTLSKDSDFKYDLTQIDGQDYVVIQGVNPPAGFQYPDNSGRGTVLIDTLTVKIPAKIEGYTVGVIENLTYGSIYTPRKAIVDVTIPDTVIEIGAGAFGNSSISSLKLPKNLKKLGNGAFAYCENLSGTITIPEGITEIPRSAFYITAITGVTIPESVTTIGEGAFGYCSELATVKLPSHTVQYPKYEMKGERPMDNDAFNECPKLSLAARNAIKASGYTDNF